MRSSPRNSVADTSRRRTAHTRETSTHVDPELPPYGPTATLILITRFLLGLENGDDSQKSRLSARRPKHTIAPYRRRVAGSSSIYRYNFTPRASVHCKSPWPGQQGNRVRKSQVHHSTRDYARTRAQRRPMAKVPAEPVGRERATTNDHACLQAVIEAASYADKTVAAAVAAAAETTPCMIAGGCRLLACVQR